MAKYNTYVVFCHTIMFKTKKDENRKYDHLVNVGKLVLCERE